MQITMVVLQLNAVAMRGADEKIPTHANVAMQSKDGDSQFQLTVPLDRAGEFMIGSEITVTVGRIH